MPDADIDLRTVLRQPEPGLTAETLIARAAAFRPQLIAEQQDSDRRGVYSDAMHEAFRAAGFYRILQPRMFGGYQLGPEVFLRVVKELAQGHPAAAWCFCLAASHGYFVASHYPPQVQAELFGPDGEFRSGQVVGPAGSMARVEGGYRVEGVWPFCSGAPVCTHFVLGSLAPQPDGPPKHVFFTVPRQDFTILPDWGEGRFMGMQASGSNSIRIDGAFVPDRLVTPVNMMNSMDAFPDGSQGYLLHRDPAYLFVALGWFHCEFGAIFSGTARAAVEAFAEMARSKPQLTNPMAKRMEDPFVQNLYGRVLGMADSAWALTLAGVRRYSELQERFAREGTPITAVDSYEVWGLAREACKLACEAVELVFHAAGATAGRTGNPLQGYFRDVEMYRLHIQNQPLLPTARGTAAFGLAGIPFGS